MVDLYKKVNYRFKDGKPGETSLVRDEVSGKKDVIDLGYGEVDFDTPSHIKEAAKKAIDSGFTRYALPTSGIDELRNAIAEHEKKYNNINADPNENILATVGGQLSIHLALQTVLNPGDEVIIADPCFMSYHPAINFAGGKLKPVEVRDERESRIDPEDVKEAITPNTKVIVLVSPDNPTGSVLERGDVKAISEIALDNDLVVLSDEIYSRFVYDGKKNYSIASFPDMLERTITINGFSKAYAMTGWRIGYIIAGEYLMNYLNKLHTNYVLTITSFVQKGAVAALQSSQECVDEIVTTCESRLEALVNGIQDAKGITCKKPKGSFYAYPNVEATGMSSLELAKYIAREARVVTYPGTAFGPSGEGHLRIATSATNEERIKEAAERITEACEKL